jgi:hypothetical protein
VFLDTLGIEYRYEPEGFNLGDGTRYLPDFYLAQQKHWIEIKPEIPTNQGREKAIQLCLGTQEPVSIFIGNAWKDVVIQHYAPLDDGWTEQIVQEAIKDHNYKLYWTCKGECILYQRDTDVLSGIDFKRKYVWGEANWCECSQCGHLSIFSLWADSCGCKPPARFQPNSPRIVEAYTAARQARFEHGEKP